MARAFGKGARGFTTLEFVAAIGILSVAMTSFFAVLRGNRKMEKTLVAQTKALVILDNVIERRHASRDRSLDNIRALLKHEFEQSDLAETDCRSTCSASEDDRVILEIKTGDTFLASVELNQ